MADFKRDPSENSNRSTSTEKSQNIIVPSPKKWYFDIRTLQDCLTNLSIVDSLENNDICILDNFLSPELADKLLKVTKHLYTNIPGLFTEPLNRHPKFRHDVICWIKGTETQCQCYAEYNLMLTKLLKGISDQYNACSKRNMKISHKSKLQISCFPKNSKGYLPHIDNPKDNGRILTFNYYPNEKYDAEEHGGVSRFYVNNKRKYINIEPKNNRLVIHWSDRRVIAETLPTYRDVFSLTCWFFGSLK